MDAVKSDNQPRIGSAALQLMISILKQQVANNPELSKWIKALEVTKIIADNLEQLQGRDLRNPEEIVAVFRAIAELGEAAARVADNADPAFGQQIRVLIVNPAKAAANNKLAVEAIAALFTAAALLGLYLPDDPCNNEHVVHKKDRDFSITNVGSQGVWPDNAGPEPKWDNPSSVKAYRDAVSDHGRKVKPSVFQDRANDENKNCRQTQFYNDQTIVDAERLAPTCPGLYVVEMNQPIGRQFVRGGDKNNPLEGLTKVFLIRRKDGTLTTIYPVRDAYRIDESPTVNGKPICPPGPDLPDNPAP
ncbi:MAG: hypothetical protein Tsb009_35760 [Planctomycetaceae bacterium]